EAGRELERHVVEDRARLTVKARNVSSETAAQAMTGRRDVRIERADPIGEARNVLVELHGHLRLGGIVIADREAVAIQEVATLRRPGQDEIRIGTAVGDDGPGKPVDSGAAYVVGDRIKTGAHRRIAQLRDAVSQDGGFAKLSVRRVTEAIDALAVTSVIGVHRKDCEIQVRVHRTIPWLKSCSVRFAAAGRGVPAGGYCENGT